MKHLPTIIASFVLGVFLASGIFLYAASPSVPSIDVSTTDKLLRVLANIIDFLLKVGGVVAVIMLIWAGVLFMTGTEDNITTAKKILLYVAIGVVTIMVSYSVTAFLGSVLGGRGGGRTTAPQAPANQQFQRQGPIPLDNNCIGNC